MQVFFYGLFMDERLLAAKGIVPASVVPGVVDDFGLHIGARATLVRRPGSRSYGMLMDIPAEAVRRLYAEESVADYRPEPVTVELADGSRVAARCYNVPADLSGEPNRAYAQSLLELAAALEFPDPYLEEIRQRC